MSTPTLTNYVAGKWIAPESFETLPIENPSTTDVIAKVPLSTHAEIDRAVAAAKAAFAEWSDTPVSRRCEFLFELHRLLRQNSESLTRLITEENGKSLPDSRAEVKRAIENVEVACGMPVLQQGDRLIGAAREIDGEVLRVP
ncbi:MAG TPA: aldehyde dehydrogenase family protein, partial [Thermoguttaceae bacterium]|nr:aldehyde dehydrogenase family protein [Thermoguttaceae bacterium]